MADGFEVTTKKPNQEGAYTQVDVCKSITGAKLVAMNAAYHHASSEAQIFSRTDIEICTVKSLGAENGFQRFLITNFDGSREFVTINMSCGGGY